MDAVAWITLGGVCFTIAVTVIGSAVKLVWWLGEKFREVNRTQSEALTAHEEKMEGLLNDHENKDQERHEENVVRFTAIETVIANDHTTPARKRSSSTRRRRA